MSRLRDLIQQARAENPELGDELDKEFTILSRRRSFGLNFERHRPEAVELPSQSIRRGHRVRILPPRGSTAAGDQRVWTVRSLSGGVAALVTGEEDSFEETTAGVDDLVMIAEFRDTIYPGLEQTGEVLNGPEDAPAHTVINGENYHALKALTYTHAGKIDAIYIDPPYNTGAKDWKYNNDYVEDTDLYRHSKWLAFMERRLLLAKQLLNPDNSVLIVTIDEKEYLRLGMLLEQLFPDARIQMLTTLITPQGNPRNKQFHRTDEYVYVVGLGSSQPAPLPLGPEWRNGRENKNLKPINWVSLLRTGSARKREDRPSMFYPIFIKNTPDGPLIEEFGEAFYGDDLGEVAAPTGTVAVWPRGRDGELRRWQVSADSARALMRDGFLRLGKWNGANTAIQYLARTNRENIESGEIPTTGRDYDGSYIVDKDHIPSIIPGTMWRISSHDATRGGTQLVGKFLPGRQFPFPKSLYAVEDVLRFFVQKKPRATVLDFFAGSGTTMHAVMRLNRQDGGNRHSIIVTNNEVSADEQKRLREQGLRPGDPEWEALGICDYVTNPRITAAITGKTPEGEPVKDDYRFTDEFPMSEGFEANARFFTLTYESPLSVEHHRAFKRIAPLLWLRAGSRGRIIDEIPERGWDATAAYGVITNLDEGEAFADALVEAPEATHAFIVTNDQRRFQSVLRQLPAHVEPVRLYESYLTNFEFEIGA